LRLSSINISFTIIYKLTLVLYNLTIFYGINQGEKLDFLKEDSVFLRQVVSFLLKIALDFVNLLISG